MHTFALVPSPCGIVCSCVGALSADISASCSAGLTANGSVPPIIYERYLSPTKNLCAGCNTTAYHERIVDPAAVLVVDFGDEFDIPVPETFKVPSEVIDPIFRRWLRTVANVSTPGQAGCAGATWDDCHYIGRSAAAFDPQGAPFVIADPHMLRRYHYAGRFARDWGMQAYPLRCRNSGVDPMCIYFCGVFESTGIYHMF